MQVFPRDFQLPFIRKERVAKDAWKFYFDRSGIADLDFLPGQFIKMILDIENPDERGFSRTFSITSSPLDKEYLTITTHIIQSAFKKALYNVTPGTDVKFFGPSGRFVLHDEDTFPHIFLAGGIGITPFHSMITYSAQKNLLIPITLFASFAKDEDMLFYDELMTISSNNPNSKIIYTLTKLGKLQGAWSGETGRIRPELVRKYCPDFQNAHFFITGSPHMVDAMLAMVKEMDISDEQVKKERFVGY
ncbi:MAG: FAD-dependent oxidoreductase [bacterium]|nr:FAD-dependent oxidoreductase [bacterium]